MTGQRGDLVFRSRALAQSHPLTALAKRFVDRAIAEQRTAQPIPEISTWADSAFIAGYCVRRVEEVDAGLVLEPQDASADPDLNELDEAASRIAAEIRAENWERYRLGDPERTVSALDHIIYTDVQRRLDHWRDEVDDKAWGELEEYITWWVVKGYALRVAETVTGALA